MSKSSAFTLIEIIICVIIIGLLSSITFTGISKYIKTSAEKKARLNLEIILSDEKDFFAFRERYTDDWSLLSVKKPKDEKYDYEITKATEDDVEIKALPKTKGRGFLINTKGEVSGF